MAADPNIHTDQERAQALTHHLVQALDAYTDGHEVGVADVLVAARAFYRTTCVWVATKLVFRGDNRLGFFRQELERLGNNLTLDHERMAKELDPRGN